MANVTGMSNAATTEQRARDMLERMEIRGARSFSSGELVEIANLIAERDALAERCEKLREALREHEIKVLGVSDDGDGSVLYYCSWCDSDWLDSPEQHGPGCLAAPKDASPHD